MGALILLRLGLGLLFLGVSAGLGYGFCAATRDHHIAAAGAGIVVTFFAGVIFLSQGLDESAWRERPANRTEPDDDQVDYSIRA